MRPLILILASLFSYSSAQGVTQLEPTAADLARLMGDVTSLEIAIPEGARSVRIAYVMGDDGGHSEDQSPLWDDGGPEDGAALRLLVLAPGRAYAFECGGEAIDVHVTYPDEFHTSGSMCTPLIEGAERYASRRKYELTLSGPTPELDTWTPVYLRAWSAIEPGDPGAPGLDLAQAFTIQVLFSAAEFAPSSANPPLDSTGLLQVPEIRWRADPFGRH